ncbi:MAG: hypothetical protein E7001_00690 [Coriobacteriaceae bacterium]|nr:hypothetical protein [Coriobacteriaceae bacterium]
MKRKTVFTIFVAALLAVCGLGLAACGGPSPEEAIRQNLVEGFDPLKSGEGNSDFAKEFEKGVGGDFESYGIDSKEFADAYLDGFDYKIGEIKVDEKAGTAVAELSITMKPMMEMLNAFASRVIDEGLTTLPADATEEDYSALSGKILMEEVGKLEPKTVDVQIKYAKNGDGQWEADQKSVDEAALVAMMGTSDTSAVEALAALAEQGSAE